MPEPIQQYWKMQMAEMMHRGKDAADRRSKLDEQLQTVAAMQRAGVTILAGSDTPNPYAFPGISLHEELSLLVTGGPAPAEALQAATVGLPCSWAGWTVRGASLQETMQTWYSGRRSAVPIEEHSAHFGGDSEGQAAAGQLFRRNWGRLPIASPARRLWVPF